ncbi:MAG TPA: glycosyltransferase family 4 protein [Tepidisphaeraceae bacterium]|jgi:glycosyltransferase involved in cell wall biosynthesis|nr:glycosyltransferase family 4 protein [Tepidisphaeraceae bacterium]
MISHYLPGGSKIGSGYQAHYMANALCRRGHHVTMFSLCQAGDAALYKTVVVPTERPRTFRFAWNLRRIDWSRFDVLHAHGDDYWLWGATRPVHVRTMHGSCFAEAVHIPRIFEKLRMTLLGLSEVMATLVADRTACVSRNTAVYYPWVKDVIVNGVDLSAFYPGHTLRISGQANSASAAPDGKELQPTILFVGTYHHRKRGALLAEAFARTIRPVLPEARLWMVCSDAPSADGVKVFGRIPLEDLAELYRRAWVFCLPSSYEGFGVPYIEAMASGTPVVATPNAGAREVLDNGKYGILCQPDQLGLTLLRLLRDSSERQRLRTLGLERVKEYSWERVVEQYEAIYARIACDEAGRCRRVVPSH